MFLTIYIIFITFIFLGFMFIIHNSINKNTLYLAKSFILLMMIITSIKLIFMMMGIYYNITLCDISKKILCKN